MVEIVEVSPINETSSFHDLLLTWFFQNKRSFPWRNDPTPYSVWVSEIMLQQTRASVVVPYFARWMRKYPDLFHLAAASWEEVLKDWEGLGYYSRVKNLYNGAKVIVEKYQGKFPSAREELEKIKGLGPYTIGAILAFGFKQKSACIDGNVMRVLSRYFGIEEDISLSSTQKKIWTLGEKIVSTSSTPAISEALIELGALVCQKKPSCADCPLQNSCKAREWGKVSEIPLKAKKILYTKLIRAVIILEHKGEFIAKKTEDGKVLANLYEFPYYEIPKRPTLRAIKAHVEKDFGRSAFIKSYPMEKQTFTRFRLDLYPFHFSIEKKKSYPDWEWMDVNAASSKAFSSGHKRILRCVYSI